ncbi:MAG: TauD/TfdA family dioxygenase [Proteobacteria bacterium]|nr:TauD/TfdA family dioxygenase [Pseudomonadota bacterium]
MQVKIPAHQESKLAWYGPELQSDTDKWVLLLDDAEIAEVEIAARKIIEQDKSIVEINKENFPLPLLGSRLEELTEQLINGIGFALVRRIPVQRYSVEQAATMFYGVGAHLGNARMQNAKGHVLGHVCDLNMRSDEPGVRIYQTHERQTFHTDSSDIVGLLCLKKAKKGGESLLVSAVTIYNEMLKARPDLVRLLFDPIATDRRGEIPEGMQPLDMFDEFANDPDLNMSMQLEPGDMQFVYNHGLLHDRTGFEDWQDIEDRRHLLRLWLSAPNDRPLPPVFKERFGSIEIGNRGGIAVQGAEPCAPMEPS